MSIPCEQNKEQHRKIKAGNKSLENVASYRYMGKLQQIKFGFKKKLRAHGTQELLNIIRFTHFDC
jgi:hypothetical protein